MIHRRSPSTLVLLSVACVLTVALAAPDPAAAAGPYAVIGSVSWTEAGLTTTETTVQAGPSPADAFKVTRIVGHRPDHALGAAVLLLSPLGPNFSFYEQRDPGGPAGSSIAGYLALRGFDVWGYSTRMEGLPAGGCEAGVVDCSVMAGWDLASIADDVGFVRTLIAAERPGVAAYLGGASLGSIAALAAIDADPAAWDGAILWEGMLWSTDPAVRAMNQAYCAGLEAQLAGGIYFDGVGGGIAKQAGHLARVHPDGLTPMPLFPPFFTNHQVLVALFAEEAPGPVTLPVPGYRLMSGSLAADRFDHASEARLSEDLERFNNYSPTALVRDISCSLAGLETAYVDGLGDFTGAVLAIGGGLGFGPYMGDTLDLLGSDDVTFLLTPGFGHIDHFMTPDHRDYVERPIVDWLRARR